MSSFSAQVKAVLSGDARITRAEETQLFQLWASYVEISKNDQVKEETIDQLLLAIFNNLNEPRMRQSSLARKLVKSVCVILDTRAIQQIITMADSDKKQLAKEYVYCIQHHKAN